MVADDIAIVIVVEGGDFVVVEDAIVVGDVVVFIETVSPSIAVAVLSVVVVVVVLFFPSNVQKEDSFSFVFRTAEVVGLTGFFVDRIGGFPARLVIFELIRV